MAIRPIRELANEAFKELKEIQTGKKLLVKTGDPLIDDSPMNLVFIHDSLAFNQDWALGRDISPLLLCPDAHHGNCFVEFMFNPAGYTRQDGRTVLRHDWLKNASIVSEEIERDARRLLGMETEDDEHAD